MGAPAVATDQWCRINGRPGGAYKFSKEPMRSTWVPGDGKVCDAGDCGIQLDSTCHAD